VAPEIVALLPPKWSGLTSLVVAYGLTTLILPLNYLALAVLTAHGRAGLLLRIAIGLIPLCWMASVAGVLLGSVLAMVCAWSFSVALATGSYVWFVSRYLRLPPWFLGTL